MSTHLPVIGGHEAGALATQRKDNWWLGPTATFLGLSAFLVYVHWALFQAEHFTAGPYLSPLYSPVLFHPPTGEGADHAWFGAWPSWWPSFLPPSPAMLILVFPASFRFTCYYYRKAYYRSFAGSPPGCAVGPIGQSRYNGETRFLIFQNLHRFALYFAVLYIPILYYDAFISFRFNGEWGIGVGTLILLVNATLLAGYTFGCHCWRHLIAGKHDCMSVDGKPTLRYTAWRRSTWFNARHMQFAWASLIWVAFTDVYVRLVSMGVITDLNTWN